MEILAQFGTPLQQEQWLRPAARRRDPLVLRDDRAVGRELATPPTSRAASSADGDDYVINGHKWFTSGALDPRCKFAIFMGVTDPDADPYRRQSMILVPMDTPGVTVVRGAARCSATTRAAATARRCSRTCASRRRTSSARRAAASRSRRPGSAPAASTTACAPSAWPRRALELMCMRAQTRVAFGKPLADQGVDAGAHRRSRASQIEQARLLTMKAAWLMDTVGKKGARIEIARDQGRRRARSRPT